MSSTESKPLGEVCEVLDRHRKPITKSDRVPGPYPYYGASGVLDHVADYIFDEALVLVGEDGAKWGAGERSAFAIDGKTWVNNHAHVLRPCRDQLLDDWLIHSLNATDLTPFVSGITVPKLNQRRLKEIPIGLPPLTEQRRIVAILNRAAKIERLRVQAAERMGEFVPALFERMFGDPIENPKGWAVAKLADVGTLDRGRSRHRPRNAPELYGGPYPFVQTGDVAASGGAIRRASQRYSELGLKQSKMWPAGTLCITIAANIGETGILAFDACFPDSVVGFVPKKDRATVEYVQGALDSMQARLEERAPMAAQRNINLRILRALPVALPPIEMQRRFSGLVRQAQGTAETVGGATGSVSMVTQALMRSLLGNPREC